MGVVFALTGTAGALLWRNYSPLLLSDGMTEVAETSADEGDTAAPVDETADVADDPTEAVPARHASVASRSVRGPAAPSEEEFSPEDNLYRDDVPARPQVRRVAATVDASSHRHVTPSRTGRGAPPADEFDALADAEQSVVDSDDVPPAQFDPEELESGDDDTPLAHSANGRSRLPAVSREPVDTDLPTDLDEPEETESSQPARLRFPSQARDTGDEDSGETAVAETDEIPELRLSRPARSAEPDAEVELAAPRGKLSRPETVPAGLSAEEELDGASDDSVDGFVAVDPRERRALARTRVMRPADIAQNDGAELETENPADLDPVADPHPQPRDSERVSIAPRGRKAGAGTALTHARPAPGRAASQGGLEDHESVRGQYRVEPSDTYWSISKKVYGSPRYFQALAEHNRSRVAEPELLRPGVDLETPSEAELQSRYAKYIPGGGKSTTASQVATTEQEPHPVFGVASESPARRIGGRALAAEDRPTAIEAQADREPVRAATATGAGFHYSRSGEPLFRVGEGDTLSSIAQQHLGKSSRSQELYQLNQDRLADPNRLRIGTVLKLPTDASRVGVVSRSDRIR